MKNLLIAIAALAATFTAMTTSAMAAKYDCVVVAKRQFGDGPRVKGTRSVGTAQYKKVAPIARKRKKQAAACRRAAKKCVRRLNKERAIRDRPMPKARCVIVRG